LADLRKGFDTASSIALLAASAIAKKGADSKRIPPADIVILPVPGFFFSLGGQADMRNQMLFTAGMTLLDSIDSILMLYSYTGFPEQRFRLFEPAPEYHAPEQGYGVYREAAATRVSFAQSPHSQGGDANDRCPLAEVSPALDGQTDPIGFSEEDKKEPVAAVVVDADARIRDIRKKAQRELIVKRNMMSGLSIVLTLMSIIVAFRCVPCSFPAMLRGFWLQN
jgi:nickel/cobalt transporter (NiCoT) family protein